MKKYLFLLIAMVFVFAANAQTTPTEVSPDAYVYNASYVNIGTTDTLTDADSWEFVFRVKGSTSLDFNVGLYSDHISGTAGGTLIASASLDGVNYITNLDTITISGLTADAFDAEVMTISNFKYPYMKFTFTQTGTASTVQIPYVYAKY